MCGICGVFHRSGEPVEIERLSRMARSMTHRGPDEEGYFVNLKGAVPGAEPGLPLRSLPPGASGVRGHGNVGLGHRRLSIIDLSSGQQPLSNEDGTIWIAFNGEVYNFQSLKADLERRGHVFRTHCDTEAIVHAYEEWGERCVEKFRGMFAVAIWDERRGCLYLARDRVGKKPLYYLEDPNRLLFGSEIKALLEQPEVSREVDPLALSDYLSLLYVPAPRSIFKSVRKLPAGHYAVATSDSFEVHPYWDLPFEPSHDLGEEQMMDDFLGILEESTRLRMISDVPLGAFLSGGVDSSAVVALMAKASSQPVTTNSISFTVDKYNEAPHAQLVAELFATDHHEFQVSPEAIGVIEQLSWHYDEPFADSSAVPTYYVSKTARETVTVSLSGDGGDENFAGYRRYYFDCRENFIRNLFPRPFRKLFAFAGRLYPKADFLPRVFRGKAFISNLARDPVEAYCFSISAFSEAEKAAVFRPEFHASLGGYRTPDTFREIYNRAPATDTLSKIQYLDIKTYLCDDILTKVDRASMAVSLEVRCPLLDHVFMEYVAKIPARYKLRGTDGKHIFKKALRRYLPDDILYRRKMGFSVPILEWLRGEIREYARELVFEGEATRRYLDRDRLEKMWREHQIGLRNWSTHLWVVMMLNLWQRRFG